MAHKNKPVKAVSIDNIYRLDGRVPIAKAIPFGLQHVLAMFVSNLAPITIIAAAAQPALSTEQTGMLLRRQKITEKGGVGVVGITADEIIELFKEKGLSSVIVLEEGRVFK